MPHLFGNIFVLIFIKYAMASSRDFDFLLTRTECVRYNNVMSIFNCTHRLWKPNYYLVDQQLMYTEDLGTGFELRISIDLLLNAAAKPQRIVDVRIKGCQNMINLFQNPIVQGIVSEFKRTNTMKSACPIKANILYRTNNLTLRPDLLPSYIPDCEFSFVCSSIQNNVTFAEHIVAGKITSRRFNRRRPKHQINFISL